MSHMYRKVAEFVKTLLTTYRYLYIAYFHIQKKFLFTSNSNNVHRRQLCPANHVWNLYYHQSKKQNFDKFFY
jgi:hypothetical protein